MTDRTADCKELDSRVHDGVAVSLVWWPADDRVSVIVDSATGDSFELSIGDESPLDVFHHPFAYAAFRGLEHDAAFGAAVRAG